MFTQPYRFFINPFHTITKRSYKAALELGTDHKAKLVTNQAQPDIAAILATFDPVLDAYLAADQNLSFVLGTYKGKTQTVEELFDELEKEKLPYWEGQVFANYPKGTATATEIFPQARNPFHDGTYQQRIQAIKVLGDKCATFAPLAAVSVNILAFHTQIESARLTQQSQGEGAADSLRNARETARVLLCNEMYGNMCLLIHKHRAEPTVVGQYFDMTILRGTNDEFNVTVSGTLTSNATGLPIAGAQFVMGPYSFTSAADGSFSKSFFIDEPTTFNVTISATGFQTENTTYQFTPDVDIEQDVQLTPSVATGTISGTMKDSGTLTGLEGTITLTAPGVTITLTADAMGNYAGSGIPVGTYNATASAPNHISQSVSVTINANANTVQDFSLVVVP